MPEVTRDQLYAMLDKVPEYQHRDFLTHLKTKGYSLQGQRPDAATPAGQKAIYPQQEPQSMVGMAGQALNDTADVLRNQIPEKIAEKGGEMGFPKTAAVFGTMASLGASIIPTTPGEIATYAALGPAGKLIGKIPGVSKVIDPIKAAAQKVGTGLLARSIGVAEPFIEEVKNHPWALKKIADDPNVILGHAEAVGRVLRNGLSTAGKRISAIEDAFAAQVEKNPRMLKKVQIGDALSDFKAKVLRAGGTIKQEVFKKVVENDPSLLDQLGRPLKVQRTVREVVDRSLPRTPTITGADADRIHYYMDALSKHKTGGNFVDLLSLRRQIGSDVTWDQGAAPKVGSQAQRLLKDLRRSINEKIYQLAPEMRQADKTYSDAAKAYQQLQRGYFGSDKAETTYNRVKLAIQRGVAPSALIERAIRIDQRSEKAMRGLIQKVAAQQFEPYVRKGIAGGFLGMGAGAGAVSYMAGHGPAGLAAEASALATTSPRLAAMGIRGQDELSRQLANTHPAAIPAVVQAMLARKNQEQGKP